MSKCRIDDVPVTKKMNFVNDVKTLILKYEPTSIQFPTNSVYFKSKNKIQ